MAVLLLLVCPLACAPHGRSVGVPWLELPDLVEITPSAGAWTDVPVPVRNTGTAEAEITASAAPSPAFEVLGDVLFVAPGAEGVLPRRFTPGDATDGELDVGTGFDRWLVPIVVR